MMSNFWSVYIILLVFIVIIGSAWLLIRMRKMPKDDVASGERREHTFDGIEEYNNPLPRWWMWFFGATIIFALVYLFLYPGLGNYKGFLGWTKEKQWEQQQAEADAQYAPIFAKFGATPTIELARDPKAMQAAERLFINTCSMCHGPNAQGAKGFPNLTVNVWLFGGKPEQLEETIAHGRSGTMPPMAAAIGGEAFVPAVAHYVLKISGQKYDKILADQGEPKFKTICAACHGVDGAGNQLMGAPNLTAGKWLFGGKLADIEQTIRQGRHAEMPAHEPIIGKDKVHLLAAYIYYLANEKSK